MRLIDADAIKQKYRDKFIKSLVDKDRGIDLSEYAEEPSKSFNRFIDEIPTVDIIDKIRDEIEELQQDVLKSSETPLDSAYNISIGISMTLGVIKKYTKGEQE